MQKTTFLSIMTPVVASVVLGCYYNSRIGNEFYAIQAIDNLDLLSDLEKSKNENYSTGLAGYENSISKTASNIFRHRWWPFLTQNGHSNIDPQTGASKINTIRDYSVKLETACGSGTGWFLDYVLPKSPSTYPTKWFIATNAHVIENISFKSNPYNQVLPKQKWQGCVGRWSGATPGYTPLALIKEKIENISTSSVYYYPELWSSVKVRDSGTNSDMLDARYDYGNHDPRFTFFIDYEPKLFYAPINYIGKNPNGVGYQWAKNDYYKDFSVLEIDFKDENIAKRLTRNFYGKYNRETGTSKDKALNFFTEELISQKTSDQLWEDSKDYFVAGYAVNGLHQYIASGNYSSPRTGASKLGLMAPNKYLVKNKYNQEILGHVDVGKMDNELTGDRTTINWAGSRHSNWGYNYLLDNVLLSSGASGSLTTDKEGNVIGLYRMHDGQNQQGYVEPLRSKGVYKNGKVIYPKYDLIEGATGQISSFKSQVEKYYLKHGMTTGLSKYRNWSGTIR